MWSVNQKIKRFQARFPACADGCRDGFVGAAIAPGARPHRAGRRPAARHHRDAGAMRGAAPDGLGQRSPAANSASATTCRPPAARASRPVVFLQGDRLGRLNTQDRRIHFTRPNDKDLDTDDFVRAAEAGCPGRPRAPAIYLARAGLDGSSGDHRIRHSVLELNVTNAALDAIKKRHGFGGFHLIGQSGGSMLVGGMLALRNDIGCAVIGSVRSPCASRRGARPTPARDYFDVADAIPTIAQRRATRILVVTDPAGQEGPGAVADRLRAKAAAGRRPGRAVRGGGDRRQPSRRGRLLADHRRDRLPARHEHARHRAANIQRQVEKRVAAKAQARSARRRGDEFQRAADGDTPAARTVRAQAIRRGMGSAER